MANHADTVLISLAESPKSVSLPGPLSPASFGSVGKKVALRSHRSAFERDSFSDLVDLMAKMPCTPIPQPTPRPSMTSASNVLHFPSGSSNSCSILSPTAKPFIAEKVNDFLQEQEAGIVVVDNSGTPDERQRDLNRRLDALNSMMRDYHIDDASEPQSSIPSPPLLPAFESPSKFGPVHPPTPAGSVQPPVSVYDRASAPIVRVTKEVWESMGKELDVLQKQKRQLEKQLANLERKHNTYLDEDHDLGTQLGKLRYQNEANRDQKAAMGRSLAQKDVEIKQQRLDIDNLNKKVVNLKAELNQCGKIRGEADWLRSTIEDNDASHARELATHVAVVRKIEEANERLIIERDAAIQAQVHAGDHATRAQNLADTLIKREKVITDQRQKLIEEQLRATDLEDEVERLREKLDLENLDNLKEKLRNKTSQCDRFRTHLKEAEQQLRVTQSRLTTAMNGGEALKGGAHLVVPNAKSILSKVVMSCSECYALNKNCDNGARCRNCVESNGKCARWRCSMKHKLGECHLTPCVLPHDSQGWLISEAPRPEW